MQVESITISAGDDRVSALYEHPTHDRGQQVILLAHGAGLPMDSPFMTTIAAGLAAAGYPVLRFNYAYAERMQREGTRRPPDRRPRLEQVHLAALGALRDRAPGRPVILAGKSMGGRMSSLLAAEGEPCSGLAFFGYPLHPARKTDRLRSEHFPDIRQPSLFMQGTRDVLCQLDLLERELGNLGGHVTLRRIEDADHDFKVPKRAGRSRDELLAELVQNAVSWAESNAD
ncbi:MAG: putative alpha/beta-hydrolase family hydrolase [Chlamydiales bacterium]|jgi:predicted alpha/beta-hydrolase family hydrolase